MDDYQKQFVNVQVAVAQDAVCQLLDKAILLHFDDILPTARELVNRIKNAENITINTP